MPVSDVVPDGRRYLKKRAVALRYGSSLKTVDRWVADRIIPPPAFEINGLDFWAEDQLDECDRERAAVADAKRAERREQLANSSAP